MAILHFKQELRTIVGIVSSIEAFEEMACDSAEKEYAGDGQTVLLA